MIKIEIPSITKTTNNKKLKEEIEEILKEETEVKLEILRDMYKILESKMIKEKLKDALNGKGEISRWISQVEMQQHRDIGTQGRRVAAKPA